MSGRGSSRRAFVFRGDFGKNEITDWAQPDTIQLDKASFGSVRDILAHDLSTDALGNAVITDPTNPNNKIVLDHVGVNQLHASDFILV